MEGQLVIGREVFYLMKFNQNVLKYLLNIKNYDSWKIFQEEFCPSIHMSVLTIWKNPTDKIYIYLHINIICAYIYPLRGPISASITV